MSRASHHVQHRRMRTTRVVVFHSAFVAQIRFQVFKPFRILWSQTRPCKCVVWSKLILKLRMKYSPTYQVVWMVGPRKGQNFFLRLTLRDLALWSWASRSYGEVASPSEAWREADMAACAAVSSSLPGRHRSSQLYRDEQRRGHDRPS